MVADRKGTFIVNADKDSNEARLPIGRAAGSKDNRLPNGRTEVPIVDIFSRDHLNMDDLVMVLPVLLRVANG